MCIVRTHSRCDFGPGVRLREEAVPFELSLSRLLSLCVLGPWLCFCVKSCVCVCVFLAAFNASICRTWTKSLSPLDLGVDTLFLAKELADDATRRRREGCGFGFGIDSACHRAD